MIIAMKIIAQHKGARMAPRKLRVLREMLVGLAARDARAQLTFMPGKAAEIVLNVLDSAIANAQHNFDISADKLTINDLVIDGAVTLKRFRPRSRGMANPILKRSSHVSVIVSDGSAIGKGTKKKRKTDIETIDVSEVVKQEQAAELVEKQKDKAAPADAAKTVSHSKKEEAYGKVKMMQKGSDQSKTHRRKSIGD